MLRYPVGTWCGALRSFVGASKGVLRPEGSLLPLSCDAPCDAGAFGSQRLPIAPSEEQRQVVCEDEGTSDVHRPGGCNRALDGKLAEKHPEQTAVSETTLRVRPASS